MIIRQSVLIIVACMAVAPANLCSTTDPDDETSLLQVDIVMKRGSLPEGSANLSLADHSAETGLLQQSKTGHGLNASLNGSHGAGLLHSLHDDEQSPNLLTITMYSVSLLFGLIVLDVGAHLADQVIKDVKKRLVMDHLVDGAAASLGMIVSFIWYSLVQEFILQHKYPSGEEFPDASFLILFDRIFAICVSGVALMIAGTPFQWRALQWCVAPGLLDYGSSYLIDKSIGFLAYPVVTVFKCSKVVPTMACNTLVNGEKYGFRDYVLAALICAGVAGFKFCNDGVDDGASPGAVIGTILIIAGLIADALTSCAEKWIFKKFDGFGHMQMMFGTSVVGGIIGFLVCWFSVGFTVFFNFLSRNPAALGHMVMMATGCTLGVYFLFYLIDHHGPVSLAIALLVKQISSVYVSAALYDHTITLAATFCAILTCMAVLARPVLRHLLDKNVEVPLRVGALRKGLNFTAEIRKQLGHEVNTTATVLLAAARLEALLTKSSEKGDPSIREHKIAFSMMDRDGSGLIDKKELSNILNSLGHRHSEEEVQFMGDELNPDGNTITFDQFSSLLQKLKRAEKEEDLREAFNVFDEDHSGSISKDELLHILTSFGEKVSEDDVNNMIAEVGHDGEINFQEFVKMMHTTPPHPKRRNLGQSKRTCVTA